MVQKLIWLSIAGACGTLSRFALCEAATRIGPKHMGTFAVNIIGCFLFGLVYTSVQNRLNISNETRAILLVGFMGAFTTFSTFAFDTAKMLKSQMWLPALANVMGQTILGVAALVAGVLTGRSI